MHRKSFETYDNFIAFLVTECSKTGCTIEAEEAKGDVKIMIRVKKNVQTT